MKIFKLPVWAALGGLLSLLFTAITVLSSIKLDVSGGATRLLTWPAAVLLTKVGVTDTDPWLLYFLVVGNIVNFCAGSVIGLLISSIWRRLTTKPTGEAHIERGT